MDKPRPRTMDVTAPRQNVGALRRRKVSRRTIITAIVAGLLVISAVVGWYAYRHRNDQVLMHDRYQVVYLTTGQVYIGKLQNTEGGYMTLKNVYTLQGKSSGTQSADNSSDLVQVMRQVYGPEDSMAIRTSQVQFWQNLRSDSKVTQAIKSAGQPQ